MNKILCWLGFHSWTYRSIKTGVYLHYPWLNTDLKRCDDCGKKEPK